MIAEAEGLHEMPFAPRHRTAAYAARMLVSIAVVLAAAGTASTDTAAVVSADAAEGLIVTSVDRAQSPGSTSAPPRDVLVVRLTNPTRVARQDAALLLFRDHDRNGRYDAEADQLLLRHALRTPIAPGAGGVEVVPLERAVAERADGALIVARAERTDGSARVSTGSEHAPAPAVACCMRRDLTALALDEQALSIAARVENQTRLSSTWTIEAGHVAAGGGGGLVLLHREDEAFDVEIRVMFPRGAYNDAGIVFGFRDPRHWYQLRIDEQRMRLMRLHGDRLDTLASGAVDIKPGRWYALRVQVRKLSAAGFVDDRQALAFDGPIGTRGAVGVMQDHVQVRYASIVHTPHRPAADRPREPTAKP